MLQKAFWLELKVQQKEECRWETEDINTLIQEQKQMQEHTTVKLGLLGGELHGDLNWREVRLSAVEESIANIK